ncbi:MAG: hypothetical protein N2Z62_04355 [Rhodobacteraceae bacterium]|nr:hypothetical protein [Paracoccaceae bacterium]
MPNTFAFLVLYSWPLVVFLLFRALPAAPALAWSVLAGYLLLPTRAGFDLPLVPTIDKDAVPILSAGLMMLLGVGARNRAAWQPAEAPGPAAVRKSRLIGLLLLVLFLSPVVTVLTNGEPVPAGPGVRPALRPHDMGSIVAGLAITVLPFLLARRLFASPQSHAELLRIIVLAMLAYSAPILFEVRMSPQLNVMIYGFFPHEFLQHMRAGGFRPVVFLHHGLWLAILLAMAVLAAAALWRHRLREGRRGGQWLFAAIYLAVVLFLSNSLGAFILAMAILPAMILFGVRGQLLLAGIVAGVVLLYPTLRGAGLIPVDRAVEIARSISAERAQSLEFRLDNEDALLEKANLKPLAGWGTWGRNLVYDPETGADMTITDGTWIIVIGVFGWLGYIAQFGLLALPIILLAVKRATVPLTPATAGLALLLCANLIDMIMNDTLTPVTWMIGGALAGLLAYRVPAEGAVPAAAEVAMPRARAWQVATEVPAGGAPGGADLRSGRRRRDRSAGPVRP